MTTKIEWAHAGLGRGESWNPIRARNRATDKIGWHCVHKSEGCRNCYAEDLNRFRGTGLPYKPGHEKDIEIFLDDETLRRPLKWRQPTGIFPGSMTDLFADFITDDMLDRIFAVAALTPRHRYLFVTKRPARMREYLERPETRERIADAAGELWDADPKLKMDNLGIQQFGLDDSDYVVQWPLPNVWLLVSVEDQATADERIPDLLATPAAIRGVSFEPALAPVDFTRIALQQGAFLNALSGEISTGPDSGIFGLPSLDMIITGGESGEGARGSRRAIFQSTRDQCAAGGVAYFHKQNGEWIDADEWLDGLTAEIKRCDEHRVFHPWRPARPLNFDDAAWLAELCGAARYEHQSDGTTLIRVGKHVAGRLLDGVEHNQFPEVRRG